jgi:hypothetical protein
MSIVLKWHTRQIDFVLAFPQADAECENLFMDFPPGIKFEGYDRRTHVIRLIKNLYGQKQAGRVWNIHLVKGLIGRGFVQSKVDECVFYYKSTILLLYVDDGCLCGPDAHEIESIIKSLKNEYNVTDEGNLEDYVGVLIERMPDGREKLSQPRLISQIIDDVGFGTENRYTTKIKKKPAASSVLLRRDLEGEEMNEKWEYRSLIGKLNYLEKSTRPEIAYATHQCSRFSANPKQSHANAVKYLVRYLVGTAEEGIYLRPDVSRAMEVHVDCDFAGNWNREDAHNDASTAKSRTGYVITYAGCPVMWASKLQTEVTLSTTESEYVGLSESLRSAIFVMNLIREMSTNGFTVETNTPKVFCKVFEDNEGAIQIAKAPKMRPRTRHLNQKYHHFREHVKTGTIEILHVETLRQTADIFTKPLCEDLFLRHRKALCDW